MLNTENIQSLIDSGEGYNVEFKVRVPSKVRELTEEILCFRQCRRRIFAYWSR